MTTEIMAGMAALLVAALSGLIWYANRAGQNAASVRASEVAKRSADRLTRKAQAMAQAEANKPATQKAVLQRLDDGSA